MAWYVRDILIAYTAIGVLISIRLIIWPNRREFLEPDTGEAMLFLIVLWLPVLLLKYYMKARQRWSRRQAKQITS